MSRQNEKLKREMADDIRKTVKEGSKRRKTNKKVLVKKLIIWILAIAVVAGIIVALKNRKIKIKENEISEYNYFIISENGKTGVIDKTGKIVIKPEYDYIQIPNPEKAIFVCLYDYDTSVKSYNSKVLNEKGDEIYSKYSNVTAIPSNNTSIGWSYQTAILKYKEGEKYGIITTSGKQVTKAIYDSIETLDYKDGILKIKQNEKYGLIKLNGEVVLKSEYDTISTDGYYNDQTSKYENAGYIVSKKSESGTSYGYISYNGKTVLDCKYNSIKRITNIKNDSIAYLITVENGKTGLYKNGQSIIKNEYESIEYDNTNQILAIEQNGKYGVYDLYGNMILPIQYDDLTFAGTIITATKDGKGLVFDANGNIKKDFNYTSIMPTKSNDYYITINNQGKYGVVDSSNTTLIDNKYSYIEYVFDKYFIFTDENKSGLIDYTGRKVLENKYSVVQNINGTNIIQATNSDTGISEIYNKNIEKVAETKNAHIYLKDNYIKILSDDTMMYVDYDGNVKKAQDLFTNNSIFAQKQNGKWGYVDISGNVVVDYIYDMAMDVNEYGFAAIKKDGKWGVIDGNKQVIKEPVYTITDANPTFIGEYYKKSADYELDCYSNDITK